MAQIDSSILFNTKSINLGDLADSYLLSQKMAQDRRQQIQDTEFKKKQMQFAQNADNRAGSQEKREQTVHDETLVDLATKRKDARRARINAILGEEAETIATLPSEKRSLYYTQHLLPDLTEAGFDTDDMPEYSDDLIHGWRMNALTPGERSDERKVAAKGEGWKDLYDLKIDEAGKYVYMPKMPNDPRAPSPIKSETGAPPQIGYGQGAYGPAVFATPRSGQGGTATPLVGPDGKPAPRPLIQMPETVKASIRSNSATLNTVKSINQLLSAGETTGTGPMQALANSLGFVGRVGLQMFDEKGAPSRQLIGKLSSLKMKDISGAVINAHEHPRLAQWIPQLEDTKPIILQKLQNFALEVASINKEMAQQYTQEQGFREDPLLKGQGKATVAPKPKAKAMTEADIDNMSEEELKAYLGGG